MAQEFYKKIYSVREFYPILYDGVRTMKYMIKAKKKKELSPEFIERIMLGVTEVNGCEVCCYAHTKMALEQGMTAEEIQKLLVGSADEIPVEEMPAYLFAQHYADRRGYPTEESWNRIVSLYGEDKAKGILGAVRAIMVGNAHGIAISAFISRLKGKAVKKSSLLYEITMMLSIVVYLPLTLVQVMMDGLFKRPIITF